MKLQKITVDYFCLNTLLRPHTFKENMLRFYQMTIIMNAGQRAGKYIHCHSGKIGPYGQLAPLPISPPPHQGFPAPFPPQTCGCTNPCQSHCQCHLIPPPPHWQHPLCSLAAEFMLPLVELPITEAMLPLIQG